VFLAGDEPITVVAVDTQEKVDRALRFLDQMIGAGLVVFSDLDVISLSRSRNATRLNFAADSTDALRDPRRASAPAVE
jgi:hypothetical protein